MIKTLKVANSYGEELTMTLRSPEDSGYAITNITGIGPTDVDIKQTQLVSGRKWKYNSGFHKYREITLSIIYYEGNDQLLTVEELRNNLYKYFKTNDLVTLYFTKDDNKTYAIAGWVSKHDPVFFSNNCGSTINIICPDPWFRKNSMTYVDEVESQNSHSSSNDALIIYDGNISTGFILETTNSFNIEDFKGQTIDIHVEYGSMPERDFIVKIPGNYSGTNEKLYIDLFSDIISVYTMKSGVKTNHTGWIDSRTISERQEIPEILPDINIVGQQYNNLISIYIEPVFNYKVSYNTLYRGL